MLRFLAIRLLQAIPVLLVMSVITFIIIQAPPGDYADFLRTNMIVQGNATVEAATRLGTLVAERAKAAGIDKVVFDRGGFLYHGRVAAAAQAARDAGLEF